METRVASSASNGSGRCDDGGSSLALRLDDQLLTHEDSIPITQRVPEMGPVPNRFAATHAVPVVGLTRDP